jgi:mRNA interferase MazF
MTTEPGQVYLVDLGMAAKTRPMLVVSRRDDDAPRALSVCAPITTSTRDSEYEVSIGKPKFLHEASYVNVQGLQAIQHHELKRMIGRLSESDLQAVKSAIKWLFDIDSTVQK